MKSVDDKASAIDLPAVLAAHAAYLRGDPTGARANLRDAYLRSAYLSGADLRSAYLSGADLRSAYLSDADLPSNYRIASLCFGGWVVTVTPTDTSIGCVTKPNEGWLRWEPDDRVIAAMDDAAPAWWAQHKDTVRAAIRDVMGESK